MILILILILILAFLVLQSLNRCYIGGNLKNYQLQIKKQLTYKIFPDLGANSQTDKFSKFNNQLYPRSIYAHLISRLNLLGWVELHDHGHNTHSHNIHSHNIHSHNIHSHKTNYADFVFSLSNQQDHKIKANLKYGIKGVNNLYKKDILYKLNLSNTLNVPNASNAHIPHTEDILDYKWHNNIVIVKEVLSYGQKGVYVIIDEHEFIKLKSKLLKEKKTAIVSTYIKNPLLFKGKKFHLRVLICVFVSNTDEAYVHKYKISHMKKMITMKTASKPYKIEKKEDYLDPEMNITGGAMSDELYIWPDDFEKSECIHKGEKSECIHKGEKSECTHKGENSMYKTHDKKFIHKCEKSIYDAVNSIPLNKDIVSLYDEQNAGFFIYAADILLDDTGHAWILELNKKPQHIPKIVEKKSISFQEKYRSNYFTALFDWLLDDFILPYFGY
jgi:hypothetical protein